MNITSKQVIQDIKNGLEGVDPSKVRTIRIVAHPEALLLAESLAPEVMVETFGGCGNLLYTVTAMGPTEGKAINVVVHYTNPADNPKLTTSEADKAIKNALGHSKDLSKIRADLSDAKSILAFTKAITPKEGDSKAEIAHKLNQVPKLIDKLVDIKKRNPDLWATVIKETGVPNGELQQLKTLLKMFAPTIDKIIFLID